MGDQTNNSLKISLANTHSRKQASLLGDIIYYIMWIEGYSQKIGVQLSFENMLFALTTASGSSSIARFATSCTSELCSEVACALISDQNCL